MVHAQFPGRDDLPLHAAGSAVSADPLVAVVDDDDALRDSVQVLLAAAGIACAGFASAREFLDAWRDAPGCVLLDVRMPDMSGLRLQDELVARQARTPIVFMTGHGDVPMAVEAMKKGALDFIEKPYRDEALIACVRRAIATDAERRRTEAARSRAQAVIATLTAREREVLEHLVAGKTGRAMADALGITPKTVEFHRARIMQKLGVRTREQLYALVRQ